MSDQGSRPDHPADEGAGGPDPFSREGAAAGEGAGTPSGAGASAAPWTSASWSPGDPVEEPGYPVYGQPSASEPVRPPSDPAAHEPPPPQNQPSAGPPPSPPAESYPQAPPYQQAPPHQQTPPYQQPYAQPWAEQPQPGSYGSAPDPYAQPGGYGGPPQPGVPAAYGDPGAYGTGYGYGYGPTDHPQATPALVTGIIGLVLSLGCGLGGLVGIAGIVLGNRAKREIDGDPARWTGRGKAQAGVVTGIIGLVVLALWTVVFVIVGVAGG